MGYVIPNKENIQITNKSAKYRSFVIYFHRLFEKMKASLYGFFVLICVIGLAQSWTYVMVDDEALALTADVILDGTVINDSPYVYGNLPATNYKVCEN